MIAPEQDAEPLLEGCWAKPVITLLLIRNTSKCQLYIIQCQHKNQQNPDISFKKALEYYNPRDDIIKLK